MKSSRVPVVVLALLVAAVCALNALWLSYNTIPPHWDQAVHMISALKYHDVLSQQCLGQSHFTLDGWKHCAGELDVVDHFVYPPLFPLVGGIVIFLAGSSITALAMTNMPFIAMLAVATYLIGRTIYSRLAGVLAALLIIAYPLLFQTSREFMLEFALLAISAGAAACLVLTDRFRRTGMTVLFGLTIGLGALTKFTFLTYLLGPGIYVLALLIADIVRGRVGRREATRRLVTLAGALALGFGVAGLWYWPNRAGFLESLRFVASLDVIGAPVLSPASLTYYLDAMIWRQLGPPLFLLFLYGAWRFSSHVSREWRDFLLVWMGSIYVIETAVVTKAVHEDIGIFVPAAVISAIGIASLRRHRYVGVAAVSCFVALQLAILTLPESVLGARAGTFGWTGVVTPFPRTEDWKIEGVLQGLGYKHERVAVVSDHLFINGTTLQFYTLKDSLPLDVSPCWRLDPNGTVTSQDLGPFDIVIAKSDTGWIKPGPLGCFRGPNGREEYAALIRRLKDRSAGFAMVRSLALPDGSSLLVFAAERLNASAGTDPGIPDHRQD